MDCLGMIIYLGISFPSTPYDVHHVSVNVHLNLMIFIVIPSMNIKAYSLSFDQHQFAVIILGGVAKFIVA